MISEPLQLQFDVACAAEHAFEVWTSRTAMWWPVDHTFSEEKNLEIIFERHAGGRIFERTTSGTEHEWGEILVWDPPRRFSYLWFLGAQPADATEVEITFVDRGPNAAQIRIEHRGWERLGAQAAERREGNHRGWDALMLPFIRACAATAGGVH
jgi:hypothetical protein